MSAHGRLMRSPHFSACAVSSSIEPLEARIAPAAVVMITETDGDTVAVKTSKGTVEQLTAGCDSPARG